MRRGTGNPYSKPELIALLRGLARKLGRAPTRKELTTSRAMPGLTTYLRRWGSWRRAVEAAGLTETPDQPRGRPPKIPLARRIRAAAEQTSDRKARRAWEKQQRMREYQAEYVEGVLADNSDYEIKPRI